MDKLLNLIGLAKKAGKLEVGEEPVGAAARSKHARLILIASDAADNTRRRALHFGEAGECICLEIPPTKEDLGRALGRTSCALPLSRLWVKRPPPLRISQSAGCSPACASAHITDDRLPEAQ